MAAEHFTTLYHVNLTVLTKYKESHILCDNELVYARFEDVKTLLYVFTSVVRGFVR